MSYDQHQLDAKLIVCATCKREYFVTNTEPSQPYVCIACRAK